MTNNLKQRFNYSTNHYLKTLWTHSYPKRELPKEFFHLLNQHKGLNMTHILETHPELQKLFFQLQEEKIKSHAAPKPNSTILELTLHTQPKYINFEYDFHQKTFVFNEPVQQEVPDNTLPSEVSSVAGHQEGVRLPSFSQPPRKNERYLNSTNLVKLKHESTTCPRFIQQAILDHIHYVDKAKRVERFKPIIQDAANLFNGND